MILLLEIFYHFLLPPSVRWAKCRKMQYLNSTQSSYGKNELSLGAECSVLINWRDNSGNILEKASSRPMQNLIWFNVYCPCLERRQRDLGSRLRHKYLIHSFFYSLFIGLLRCATHCESNELEAQVSPAPPLTELCDLEQVPFFMC